MVIPELLQRDFLHHYHKSVEGGHQGIGRTYQRIKANFHWRVLYRSVQRYVGECVDCETGKGRPSDHSGSPGNLQATYPFQILAMDHIPSLPRSFKGNTELLLWVDLISGYVIAKASSSRTAQTIAENLENVFSEDSVPVRRSDTIESQHLCLISSELSIRPQGRSNVLIWRIERKQIAQRNVWCKR